mmetsp:Transcript_33590/g.95018  ORF Transcript_33590/g.95018 Transcript_33590/m.95018 type:complete len:166 (-) Transcript_33590:259-756(-)
MSEDHGHDVTFDSADAGSSTTFPVQAGSIRKGGHIVIKGRPCKVIEVSTSKTGKHGHAKCHFVGVDLFTGKKMEELVPSSHNCESPFVTRTEFTLTDISDDDYVCLMTEAGDTREDLTLPDKTDDDKKLAEEIRAAFEDADKNVVVTVMGAMKEESIISFKTVSD